VAQQPAEQRPSADSKLTPTLVTLGCVALAAALVTGINDNLPGVALLFGSIICFALAIVRKWSRPRSFLWLAAAAAISFVLFGVLHNVLYGLGKMASGQPFLHGLCEVLHVVFFLIAVLLCPPTLVVGLLGALVTSLVSRRGTHLEIGGSP
jgi:hypothetical protein